MKKQKFNRRYIDTQFFCNFILTKGGSVHMIDPSGIDKKYRPGFMNPSIMELNGKLVGNLRVTNYVLNIAEYHKNIHCFGPLLYVHREDDVTLRTWNYYLEFDSNYNISKCLEVDTSLLDIPPRWEMTGLEDGRIVYWNGKVYLTGVRRDTEETGIGRMELSELKITDSKVKEISRVRIKAPGADNTYCEKNWMPFEDIPFTYLKWSNPTEIVEANPISGDTTVKSISGYLPQIATASGLDIRGNSQLIKWKEGYLAITHTVDLTKNYLQRKNGIYLHQFVYYERGEAKSITKDFSFLGGRTEFALGMCRFKEKILITFSYQDNIAILLETCQEVLEEFISLYEIRNI